MGQLNVLLVKSEHELREPAEHRGEERTLCNLPLCFPYTQTHTRMHAHNLVTLPCVSWLSGRMCLGWTQQATFLNLKAEVSRGEAATQRSGIVSECQSTGTDCKPRLLQCCDWSSHTYTHTHTPGAATGCQTGQSVTGTVFSPRIKNAQYGFKSRVWIAGPGRPNNHAMIGWKSIIIGFSPRFPVENEILCVCLQLGQRGRPSEHVHTMLYHPLGWSHIPCPLLSPLFLPCLSKTHFN